MARKVITFAFSFGNQHHFGLHHTDFRKSGDLNNAVAGVPRNLINRFPVVADKKFRGLLIYSLT